MEKKFFIRVENIVGKGEIARYEQFVLFPQCFQKTRETHVCLFGKGLIQIVLSQGREKSALCGGGLTLQMADENSYAGWFVGCSRI